MRCAWSPLLLQIFVCIFVSPVFWTGSRLVNHLLHSKGKAEVKAGVYVCPGHTHIRSDLIGAECAACLPMAPEPTWPRKANLYGLCKQGLCLLRSAGNQADSIFIHAWAYSHTLKGRSQGSSAEQTQQADIKFQISVKKSAKRFYFRESFAFSFTFFHLFLINLIKQQPTSVAEKNTIAPTCRPELHTRPSRLTMPFEGTRPARQL